MVVVVTGYAHILKINNEMLFRLFFGGGGFFLNKMVIFFLGGTLEREKGSAFG